MAQGGSTTIRVSADLLLEVKKLAAEVKISPSQALERCLRAGIAEIERKRRGSKR